MLDRCSNDGEAVAVSLGKVETTRDEAVHENCRVIQEAEPPHLSRVALTSDAGTCNLPKAHLNLDEASKNALSLLRARRQMLTLTLVVSIHDTVRRVGEQSCRGVGLRMSLIMSRRRRRGSLFPVLHTPLAGMLPARFDSMTTKHTCQVRDVGEVSAL